MNKFIEGNILKTAAEVLRTGIGTPVLIDSKEDTEKLAEEDSVPTEGFEYFDTTDAKFVDAFAEDYIAKNEGKRSYRNDVWCMGFSCYDRYGCRRSRKLAGISLYRRIWRQFCKWIRSDPANHSDCRSSRTGVLCSLLWYHRKLSYSVYLWSRIVSCF